VRLDEPAGNGADARDEDVGEAFEGDLGPEAVVQHPDHEGQQCKQHEAADAMQDGDDAGRRKAVADDLRDVNIGIDRSFLDAVRHGRARNQCETERF
jgi:hypothetical protein